MYTLAVANYKGGTSKTTTALNLAAELAAAGHRVLVADADTSANATTGMGVAPLATPPGLALRFDSPVHRLREDVVHTAWGVDVLPSGRRLALADRLLDEHEDPASALRAALASLAPLYDYAVIDCPARFGVMTRLAVVAADHVIIPIDVKSPDSLDSLAALWLDLVAARRKAGLSAPAVSILPCRVDRTRLAREVVDELAGHPQLGPHVARQAGAVIAIPEAVSVAEARHRQISVRAHDPTGKGAAAYAQFATAIAGQAGQKRSIA